MSVTPGAPYTSRVVGFSTGLEGVVRHRLVDNDNNVVYGPSITGITEDPLVPGAYDFSGVAPLAVGTYGRGWDMGTDETLTYDSDLVVAAGVTPEGAPVLGPCVSWVTAEEVAACCSAADIGSDVTVLDAAAVAASQVLFELSGRQFSGSCEVTTARPFADGCGCWDWLLAPMSPGAPQVSWGSFGWGFWGGGWGWGWDGCGTNWWSCGALSRAILSGYPVTQVTEVKIDGVVVDPSGYRLDGWKYLTRLADADGNPQFWPSCQRLDLADTEVGTWSVSYLSGVDPPPLGIQAAAQLACQIYLSCAGSASCMLPQGVTRIDRQGISIERVPFLAWGLQKGSWATGIPLVDLFLSAYNPAGLRRRTAVWDPDLAPFAERLGT